MKVVVGLGNPGRQYAGTRHNVGFEVLTRLSQRWQLMAPSVRFQSEITVGQFGGHKVLLVAPQTYMNRSGEAVQKVISFWKVPPEDIVVICDDMNLPLGSLRWRAGGSSGGQKGLADILLRLGTEQVPRLRLGVSRPAGQIDPANWVLTQFRESERSDVEFMVLRAAESVETWIEDGIMAAMNRFNGSGLAE